MSIIEDYEFLEHEYVVFIIKFSIKIHIYEVLRIPK